MGKRKQHRRSRGRGTPTAGTITLQYAAADNVDAYTEINITTDTLQFPTERPSRINWIKLQFSCSPDAEPSSKTHVPLLQFEVKAPDGSTNGRMLYRSAPWLVPIGPVYQRKFKIPNAGFFLYSTSQTVVLKMIVSASANLAVTFNLFVNIIMDFKSYQGLSVLHPPDKIKHHKSGKRDDDDDDVSSAFSALSLVC